MAEHDDDLPPTEEELAASARLRDALEGEGESPDAELVSSLRAAMAPEGMTKEEHDLLVELSLADDTERAAAVRTRDEGDPVITALEAAWRPTAISEEEHRAIVAAAIREQKATGRRGVVIRVAFGAGGVLALAASVMLLVKTAPSAELPLARARSTQPLFAEPFKSGDASARIDKIALARASDYRDNRFAKWGVR